jgi:hypothetical protein
MDATFAAWRCRVAVQRNCLLEAVNRASVVTRELEMFSRISRAAASIAVHEQSCALKLNSGL